MKNFVIVCGWDADGRFPSVREEITQEEAIASLVEVQKDDPRAFVSINPSGDPSWWVIDSVSKTITLDTDQEAADILAAKWSGVRAQRNSLLAASDWRAMPDAPTMSDAWTTYRQALRNLPASQSDPDDIVFPEKPS
jgi:hypothetical protein